MAPNFRNQVSLLEFTHSPAGGLNRQIQCHHQFIQRHRTPNLEGLIDPPANGILVGMNHRICVFRPRMAAMLGSANIRQNRREWKLLA